MSESFESEFRTKHGVFTARIDSLQTAIDIAFSRSLPCPSQADLVIFMLGVRSVDDFMSIITLAKEGRGLAALSLVRSMYERAVTSGYLRSHEDEALLFAEFENVRRYKLARKIGEVLGEQAPPDFQSKLAAAKEEYDAVKEFYEVTDCKNCKTKRVNHTWNALDFVSMAGKVEPLSVLIVPAYYIPMSHTHATLKAVSALTTEERGELTLNLEQYDHALRAFDLAHLLLLNVLQIQQ